MKGVFGIFFMLLLAISPAFAQEDYDMNKITKSVEMENVIFDGKWTFDTEWKISSSESIKYEDGKQIFLRTAHYEDYIYIMLNFVNDHSLDINSDKATICFDPDNKRELKPTENDFCFSVTLGKSTGQTFSGESDLINKGFLKRMDNFDGFIAIASPSDENDRYNKDPHSTYEFRIPIDEIGRTDNYGFFFSVFDANSNKFYTWPKDLRENVFDIPSPQEWGIIVSPDKSLPELPWNTVIFASFLILIISLPITARFLKLESFR